MGGVPLSVTDEGLVVRGGERGEAFEGGGLGYIIDWIGIWSVSCLYYHFAFRSRIQSSSRLHEQIQLIKPTTPSFST
jgi:hypothetical protein